MSEYIIYQTDRYYCVHCFLDPHKPWMDEYKCKKHVEDVHGVPWQELELGEDWMKGLQAMQECGRRLSRARHGGDALARRLAQPDYGAEDFLFDFPEKAVEPYELPPK